jgi:hypothetical protein
VVFCEGETVYIIRIKLMLRGFIWVDLFVTDTSSMSSVFMNKLSACNQILGLVVLML